MKLATYFDSETQDACLACGAQKMLNVFDSWSVRLVGFKLAIETALL